MQFRKYPVHVRGLSRFCPVLLPESFGPECEPCTFGTRSNGILQSVLHFQSLKSILKASMEFECYLTIVSPYCQQKVFLLRTFFFISKTPCQKRQRVFVYFVAMAICSGVMGSSQNRFPVALYTASAIAGRGVLMTTSPMDLAPNGPVGS